MIFILIIILVIEVPITLYIAYYTEYELEYPSNLFKHLLSDLHLLLIPLIFGLESSTILHGRSIGSQLTGLRIISPKGFLMPFTGSTLRAFLVLWPSYLYFSLVFYPYATSHNSHFFISKIPLLEAITFIWLLILIPISIIWGAGQQGIHDIILNVHVEKAKPDFIKKENLNINTQKLFLKSILSSIMIAIIFTVLLKEVFPKYISNTLSKYDANIYQEINQSAYKNLHKDIELRINNSEYAKSIHSVGIAAIINPIPYKIENYIVIPKGTIIGSLIIKVGGTFLEHKDFINKIYFYIQDIILNNNRYDYFKIVASRIVNFDLLSFEVSWYCIWKKDIYKPLECGIQYDSLIVFLHWNTGLYILK